MTGHEIRAALDRARVLPSRQLGQNFLTDANLSRWIVEQLELEPDEAVVEVGPGTGSLTEHLVGRARRVILVEFDSRLARALEERFRDREDVEVHCADAAKCDGRFFFKHRPVKFLGNLPYSSGGAILKNLLGRPQPFSRAVVMLQKEVIDRLGAGPGTKDYGILSLRMQVGWNIRPLRVVPPKAFFPRPGIDSAVAVLTPREERGAPTFDARLFDELVRRGFAQRRKQLRKQLPGTRDWDEVSDALGLAATVRAEELDLGKWIELARAYDRHPLADEAQTEGELFDVVDGDDAVVGRATRGEVHSRGLVHRAVHVFVLNRGGDLWLQKRSARKDANPGLWDSSVSGHLDAGEDYREAAVRELAEETGITDFPAADLVEALAVKPSERTGWEHIRLFVIRHGGGVSFPAAEIEAMLPFPPAEIEAWMAGRAEDFSPAFRLIFRKWREGPGA